MVRQPFVNVLDHGALPNGKTFCTRAIQATIDLCAADGGGTVYFPSGTYLSGTLYLKSNVELHLDAGAVLLGSANKDDYPIRKAKIDTRTNRYNLRSLIFAEDLTRIAITGRGTIDGNGSNFKDRRHDGERPLILRVINCKDVLVDGITMQNSGFWNQHYLVCERVRVHGIHVWNHATYNVDAIDIDSCRDFLVSDCVFDSDDDAICLKGTLDRPCERITITNCAISSHCNAIKMGTDSSGGFTDITISNCAITSPRGSQAIYGLQRGISGISLEIVDGGLMDRVSISNVTIEGVEVPLFVRLGARGVGMFPSESELKAAHSVGIVRNVSLSNVTATNAGKTGSSITGIPGHEVENLSLTNVSIHSEGGGELGWTSNKIEELYDKYPEGTMFGKLASHGLYCRHVRGLRLSDMTIRTAKPDARHALVLEDVRDSMVSGLSCVQSTGGAALICMRQCGDVVIAGCRPEADSGTFIRLDGPDVTGIGLLGSDLRKVRAVAEFADGADPNCLHSNGNLGAGSVRI